MKIQRKEKLFDVYGDENWRVDFEKQAFASFRHPFITELFFAFQSETLVMLVMTLGSGDDLGKIIKRGGVLSYEQGLFYSAEITSALSYLHRKGFVYRDLKPANVLLNADGHIQLVDMGAVTDLKGKALGICSEPEALVPVFTRQRSDLNAQQPLSQFWSKVSLLSESASERPMFTDMADCSTTTTLQDMDPASAARMCEAQQGSRSESEQQMSLSSADRCESPQIQMSPLQKLDDTVPIDDQQEATQRHAASLVGTFGYMAPEMLLMGVDGRYEDGSSGGYTKAVDWWSLGVTMYKLLEGCYPFDQNFVNVMTFASTDEYRQSHWHRYRALFAPVEFDKLAAHPAAMDVILGLLVITDSLRLGYGRNGSTTVSQHPYFNSINWVLLEQKKVKPPSLPAGFQVKPLSKRKTTMSAMLSTHGKSSWVKPLPNKTDSERQRFAKIQSQFENWDYSAPAAVLRELESQGQCK
jgi:serine/threonine protein kinase